ncbi:MAG TPA: GNAT family N-acyltransferase, partial [Alphaproteobacteria bacterium]|nr:GNAT family N-acyltransferase [Alphaproteobacteria bacterium]
MGGFSKFADFPRHFGRKVCGYVANKAFNESYEVVLANTHELREECFKLRHQIFCVERGFKLDSRNGLESDGYDVRSAHFLLKHRPSNSYIATGRLILPDRGDLKSSLPLQKKLAQNVIEDHDLHIPDRVSKTCEISRIGILKSCSRQSSKIYCSGGGWATRIMRKKIADIGKLGLYRAIFSVALHEGGTPNCVFATDSF